MQVKLFVILSMMLLTSCSTPKQQQPKIAEEIVAPEGAPFGVVDIDNCIVGCPTGGSDQTLTRKTYTLNNNSTTKFANWVAYSVTSTSQASGNNRNWRRDPDLPASDTLPPAAYEGAYAALRVDRGHQAPLSGLSARPDWQSLNFLSNITPQRSDLNRGAWARLEDWERRIPNRPEGEAVHVATGPLFEREIGTLPAAPSVQMPSGYWKVIFTGTSPVKGEYAAFIMDQDTPRNANFCLYQVTVNSIEAKTKPHLKIWSDLPDAVAVIVKSHKGTLAQKMGCP